jgi:ankyrin repeat protein
MSLINAARHGDLNKVQEFIDAGADVNKAKDTGATPLFVASQKGHLEVVRALIAAGADVNKANDTGATPLFIAYQHGHLDVVHALIDAGADVNKATNMGNTPLFLASHEGDLDNVHALIAAGADVNKAKDTGATSLFIASQEGHLEVVRALIAATADVNKAKDTGATPLFMASQNGHLEVVRVLIAAGADVNKAKNMGATALFIASQEGHLEVVRALIDAGAAITKPIINAAKTDEIKNYLKARMHASIPKWSGFTKSDLEKFNSIFDTENPSAMDNVSVCPVCLKYVERSEACNYMSHNCSTSGYFHEYLYNKYKNASGIINWCTICGRICKGHNHYPLTAPNAPVPSVIAGKSPFAPDCRIDGGGGVEEKIIRFRAMREKAVELQDEVDKLFHEDAMNELVEHMWASPMLRYERTVKKIMNAKAFNIPLNAFPNNVAAVSNKTVSGPPPGSFESPEVLTGIENSIMGNDSEPVIRFKHKNAAGIMTTHESVVNKDTVLSYLETSGTKQNRCFEPACNGFLYPEEIEQAFAHQLIAPSVTDEDKAKLAAYKERFYRNYVGGRRQRKQRRQTRKKHQNRKGTRKSRLI